MNPNPLLALNHFTVPCSLTDVLTLLVSYLCFSTASSCKTKKAASLNLQPLQLKVIQEHQTQPQHSTFSHASLTNCSRQGTCLWKKALSQEGFHLWALLIFTLTVTGSSRKKKRPDGER